MRLLVVSLVKCTSTHPCGEKRGRVGRSLSSSVVVVDILVGLEIVHIHRDRRRERTLHAPPLLALVVHYVRAQRDFRCYFLVPHEMYSFVFFSASRAQSLVDQSFLLARTHEAGSLPVLLFMLS